MQQTNHNTTTKLTFGSEEHDSNSDFASDRFTPTKAGKYFCYARATTDPASYNNERDSDLKFYFNGSAINSDFSLTLWSEIQQHQQVLLQVLITQWVLLLLMGQVII